LFRFSLATLIALPIVVASFDFAVVHPVIATVVYFAIAAMLFLYGVTAKQVETQLDVKSRTGFVFATGCLIACVLVLMSVQTLRKTSRKFREWSVAHRMERSGYRKVWDEPTYGRNGQVLSRGYRWEK
jgi:ABC-type nickel/cobalt efflux system permease component RcnA|tara:strand:- start:3251 stop:3634 length:384 start_codon:yes stop_codon:yes gene_type:complete